jgi:CheY-like chemotaxis protein
MSTRPILLLEDDKVDAMAVKRALRDLNVANPLQHCQNGEEGIDYLGGAAEHPAIILLDLNMPKMNGIEFLRRIKGEDKYRRIPVIVLTTSREEQDRVDSYNLGVAGYMLKPVDYTQFVEVIRAIHLYWTLSQLAD